MKMQIICMMLLAMVVPSRADDAASTATANLKRDNQALAAPDQAPDPRTLAQGEQIASLPFNAVSGAAPNNIALPAGVTAEMEGKTGSDSLALTYPGHDRPCVVLYPTVGDSNNLALALKAAEGADRIAITGQVKFENLSFPAFLRLRGAFQHTVPGAPDVSITSPEVGSGLLDGTTDWRDVWLPVDGGRKVGAKLKNLELSLTFTGPGTVRLRALKLVKYTEPILPPEEQGETVERFDWAAVDKQDVPGGVSVGWNWWPYEGEAAVGASMRGNEPVDINLRTLGPAICSKITCPRYAIVSRLGHSDILKGSYLEMLCAYAPANGGEEVTYSSRTLADSGSSAQILGTDENRLLVLPFDATSVSGKLLRIELNLHLSGHGETHLGITRLVQYPSGFPAEFGAVPTPQDKINSFGWNPAAWERWFNFSSFMLGVVAAILMIVFTGTFVFLKRRLKRRAHEKELRRMASIDG
jgi:hypothetical protein